MTRHLVPVLAFGLLLLAACNSGGSGRPSATPPSATATPPVQLEPGDMAVSEMSRKELAQLEDPLQGQLAADGWLTRDEYEQLVFTYIQCIAESGSEVVHLVNSVGTHEISVVTRPGGSRAAVEECGRKYWNPLVAEWPLAHPLPEAELIRAEQALEACLRAEGIEPPPDDHGGIDTMAIVRQGGTAAQVMVGCARPILAELGWMTWKDP